MTKQIFIKASGITVLLAFLSFSAFAADGDAARGVTLYKAQCGSCHKLDHNLVGPQMNGVVGRKAGSVDGFAYSEPMKASGLTWDIATLDKWLMRPSALVPGTHMTSHVTEAQDCADIIAYLATLK